MNQKLNPITKFFYDLSMRNWGWMYHVFFAFAGYQLMFIFMQGMAEWLAVVGSFLGINAIGYLYEEIQIRWRGVKDARDRKEDLIANFVGSFLQMGMILYTAPKPISQLYYEMMGQIMYRSPDWLAGTIAQLIY